MTQRAFSFTQKQKKRRSPPYPNPLLRIYQDFGRHLRASRNIGCAETPLSIRCRRTAACALVACEARPPPCQPAHLTAVALPLPVQHVHSPAVAPPLPSQPAHPIAVAPPLPPPPAHPPAAAPPLPLPRSLPPCLRDIPPCQPCPPHRQMCEGNYQS